MTISQAKKELESVRDHLRALGASEEVIELTLATVSGLQDRLIDVLRRLAREREQRAGTRSERLDPAQLALELEKLVPDDAREKKDLAATTREADALDKEIEALEDAAIVAKRQPRRRPAPKDFPRDVYRHELPAKARGCPCCGTEMTPIGEDVSELMEWVPAHFRVQEHRRVKYACGRCKETVKTAPGPPKLIEKGIAAPGLLAHVVQSKYGDHVPLTRLQEIYRREGGEIPVSTMCGWVSAVAREVRPLVDRIWEKALASHTLGVDASGLKVLDRDDPAGVRRGTMWCCVGEGKYVVFRYAATGKGEDGPWAFLSERTGHLQADAASVFDRLYSGQCANATEVGCWAHARRKLFELNDSDSRVAYPLKLISQLYRVESLADARGGTPDVRHALRQERSTKIIGRLERWLERTKAKEPPKSALAKACAYADNQWKALTAFLDDPLLALDNNLVERQIRSLAVGRKNYLFAGSERGAENAAVLYSLLRTAALAGVDTYRYLADVITKLAGSWPMSRIDELLPEHYASISTVDPTA